LYHRDLPARGRGATAGDESGDVLLVGWGCTYGPIREAVGRLRAALGGGRITASAARTVRRDGRPIDLKPKEFALLEYFMRHAGQVVTRTMLLERVWDYAFDPQTNVIDVHVSRLRGKIDKDFETSLIHTIRGAGYMIRDGAR